jgi:MFS family permease
VFGVVVGGVITQNWGWQAGFGAVGVPGLILAILFIFVVRDYKTVALPQASARSGEPAKPKQAARAIAAELVRPRSALLTCIGSGLSLLIVSTTYAWLPSYFNRYYNLPMDQAGLKTGVVVLLGAVGMVIWGAIADRLTSRIPNARLYVPTIGALLTMACMCTAFAAFPPGTAQFVLLILGGLMMTASVGSTDAVVIDVSHPGVRATAAAILSLARNLLGLASGPLLTGELSDRYGLQFAMSVVPLIGIVAAVLYMMAARHYQPDLKAIAGTEPLMGEERPLVH